MQQFRIDNMVCGGCARSVTKAVQSVDASAKVVADPPHRRVDIESSASREQLESALREAGFPPSAA